MAYQPKDGDGTLFVNDKKGNQKAPDRTGYILAHRDIRKGEKLNLAGWIQQGSQGRDPFLSLRMSDPQQQRSYTPPPDPEDRPALDDEIPF